jgi:hypothetical protein
VNFADRWNARLAVARLVVRVDARRPSTWIAAVTAAGCGLWLPDPGRETPVVAAAIACGGLLAVASIGRLPSGVPAGGDRSWRWLPVLRAAWPAIGFLAGGAVAVCRGRGFAMGTPGLASIASVATALAAAAVGPLPARSEAANASGPLGIAGGAALAALAVWAGGAATVFHVLGGLLAGALMAAALGPLRSGRLDWPEPAEERIRGSDSGPLIAMIASLAAMAGCYFLAPQFAWGYAALVTGLFVWLAVPQATAFGPAAAGFVRSAAGQPPLPGSLARAVRVTATYLGILVWPALVASLLPAAAGVRVGGPGDAVAWLGCLAVGLVLMVAAAVPAGRGEAARAAVLAAASVAVVLVANQPTRFAISRRLPELSWPKLAIVGGTGVEGFPPSCETSHAAQPSGPPSAG